MAGEKLVAFFISAFFRAYSTMRKITFNELHLYKNDISEYRYFIVTGVCEPVLIYIRHFLEETFKARGERRIPEIDRGAYRRLGYDEETIDEFVEQMHSSSEYFEKSTLDGLYGLNVFETPRLCEIDLQTWKAEERLRFVDHIRNEKLDDSLLDRAPSGAYCIAYVNTVFDYMDEVDKTDRATMRNIRSEMDKLCSVLETEDARNTGRTSRLLWIDAYVWSATRQGIYSWALDLLPDCATEEFLWECSGACGDISNLRGFYDKVKLESENVSRLGVGLTKAKIRNTDLYKSLLSVDGRAFGWDVLRYYSDAKYKGSTLRTKVARSLQIEHTGAQNNAYYAALKKCIGYLSKGKRYIEKLFKVRCLLECGSLSMSLGYDALRSRECRDLCKKYDISAITKDDMERAAEYDLFVYRDVLTILNREALYANRVLNDKGMLRSIEERESPQVQPLLRVYLALGRHRKLVEKCS